MKHRFLKLPFPLLVFVFLVLPAFLLPSAESKLLTIAPPDGEALYKQHCAACHENSKNERIPTRTAMKQLPPESILAALISGRMAAQGSALNEEEKRAVSEYLAGKKLAAKGDPELAGAGKCASNTPPSDFLKGAMWNGWGGDLGGNHYQSTKAAGITPEQIPTLALKWAFGFPNGTQAFCQPTVVAGRIFVGSDRGQVYSLDAQTGCTYWSFNAEGGVRSAVTIGKIKGSGKPRFGAFFGDVKSNVYGVDAATGELLWKVKVENHPVARVTGGTVLYDQVLYVPVSSVEEVPGAGNNYQCCTFRGSVVALDIATGKQLWKSYAIKDEPKPIKKNSAGVQLYGPAGAAIWSAPTLDLKRRAIYVATGNAYTSPADEASDAIVAFDMDKGTRLWVKQVTPKDAFLIGCPPGSTRENCPTPVGPDYDFGSSPMLRELPGGKRVLVIGQKSGVLWGIDPDNKGELLWEFRAGKGGALGGIEWGTAADLVNAYAPVADVHLPPQEQGGIYAVNLATGKQVWYAPPAKLTCTPGIGCAAGQSAAIAVIPGAVFSGAVDGHLRAYSTKDGSVIWDYNTSQNYQTVNNVKANGGSINAAGPVIVNGMLFTTSGYSLWRGKGGNVLLAFAPAEKAKK